MCNSKVNGSILVASAETPTREIITALLETAGHHVQSVNCAHHAYQCLRHPEFDFDALVVTLPARDATAEVYSGVIAACSPHTSLILIGGEPGTTPSDFLRRGKAVGWLARPFRNQVLLNLVRVAIEHSMRARGNKQ